MIQLLPFAREDIKELMKEIDSKPLMIQWSGRAYSYPLTEEQVKNYMDKEYGKGSYIYKAVDSSTNETVGHIALREIDEQHELGRISYVLVYKRHRGKGIVKQIMEQILHFAFSELQLNRVSLGVFTFNKPAIACYEGFGFQTEGVHRQVCKLSDHEYWDTIEMALLKKEWAERTVPVQEKVIAKEGSLAEALKTKE
ncbi:GNAT family N-acetyltransferase [Bacillus badius]|uniref:GNAT family N-acetyltransferase n=1 Tax=Bacillus badius TaxID=1455 RepID=UPI0005ADAF59|nr:GNAT family protein [Bacillus badius]KIL75020.1 Acetyltransferase [Bacillus badius]